MGSWNLILVIGGGLAGLAAAYELSNRRREVIVLEANHRPGGRVLTLRQPFPEGLYAEAGALMIPDTHDLTLKYVSEFGLQLDPFRRSAPATIQFIDGRRESAPGGGEWLPAMVPSRSHDEAAGVDVERLVRELGDPAGPGWSVEARQQYDQLSYAEFLDKSGINDRSAARLKKFWGALWGEGADTVSALAMLRDWVHLRKSKQEYRIRGGNDLLPKAFSKRLEGKVLYGAEAVRIERESDGVTVHFRQAGLHQSLRAERVICAIPFSVLRDIEVEPGFSPSKRSAIENLPHFSATRVSVLSRRRFWRDESMDGFAITDLPIGQVFNMTDNQAAERGILQCYAGGSAARRLAAMEPSEREETVLDQMDRVYPGLRVNAEAVVTKSWDEDRFARGASSWYRPGQMAEFWPHVATPEGRVHFAGDQTSACIRWMQGALQSGLRAAAEVASALAETK